MNILKVRDDIFIVENFYAGYRQLYDAVISGTNSYRVREDGIKNFDIDNSNGMKEYGAEFTDLCYNYIFCLEEAVEKVGKFSIWPSRGNFMIGFSIYEQGIRIPEHRDTYDIHNGEKPHIWSSVHYLNSNFTGGEIVFLDIDLEIKPLKNMLLVFNSNYLHETKKIKSGQKICGTRFWKSEGDN